MILHEQGTFVFEMSSGVCDQQLKIPFSHFLRKLDRASKKIETDPLFQNKQAYLKLCPGLLGSMMRDTLPNLVHS